jgi:transcription antitermination factor NusG
MGAPYWAAVRSEPQREATAAAFLGRAGYVVYLPRVREWRVRHGRRVAVTPVLFPNYLFVRIELQWHRIRKTIGVSGIVTVSGEPAKVADTIIDDLKSRERDGYVALPEPPCLRPGDPIRVSGGLLIGATGLYSGMRGADRCAVLLAALGTLVLPASSVEGIS